MASDDAIEAAREAGERIGERIERTGEDAKAAGARISDFIEDKAEHAADAVHDAGDAAKAAWDKATGDEPAEKND